MKTSRLYSRFVTGAAVLAMGAAAFTFVRGDEKTESKAPEASPEEIQAWMEAASPGEAHKVLDVYAGEWEVTTKMWMQPGAPPMESTGKAVAKWILGNRYMEMTVTAVMMGQEFEGRAISGYDNLKKVYTSFWIDNMGTGMVHTTGSASADKKTLTYTGRMAEMAPGGKEKEYKFVDRIVSKDEIVSEIHDTSKGKDSKIMEMTYKRKK